MDLVRTLRRTPEAQPLLRPANDSLRPLSTIEVALRVDLQPTLAGAEPAWRLDRQYEDWLRAHFPRDPVWFCPLDLYDREVRPADAHWTLEELHHRSAREAAQTGGHGLTVLNGWRRRTAMFAVGSYRLKALTEFLFAWG